jgi:hypothetical protein
VAARVGGAGGAVLLQSSFPPYSSFSMLAVSLLMLFGKVRNGRWVKEGQGSGSLVRLRTGLSPIYRFSFNRNLLVAVIRGFVL